MKHQMICQRIYEKEQAQGLRVLVDRLWPRGIKKVDAKVDLWEKEIAPSNELRKFFSHIPERFPEFKERYLRELEEAPGKEDSNLQGRIERAGSCAALCGKR